MYKVIKVLVSLVVILALNSGVVEAVKKGSSGASVLKLSRKAKYTRPSIDSVASISKKKELKVRDSQKFLISNTGAIISLENSYNFLKEKETDTADTTIGINISQPLSPKEVLVNKRLLRDIEDDYNLSLRALKSGKENFISKIINSYLALIRQEMSIERSRKNIETRLNATILKS